jgi:hypothetical protein
MRGHLDGAGLEREFKLVRSTLKASGQPHLDEFLAAWQEGTSDGSAGDA